MLISYKKKKKKKKEVINVHLFNAALQQRP